MESHYQPIVALDTGAVVAYEALARENGRFPAERFASARLQGTLPELDAECRRAAFAGARGLDATLFVNVEPECFDATEAPDPSVARVVVELTERGLTTRPAELLLAVERIRARGWGIAVDDVGVDWRSLALMPFLLPDVVKLDRGVVADPEAARVVRSVHAHIERHGGLLLAEGIETPEHEARARAFGADLAQGWHYGRPAPLPAEPSHGSVELVSRREPIRAETPYQVLRDQPRALAVGTKAQLLPLSMDLEREAASTRDPAVVLATFQDASRFGPGVRERYARMAQGAAFVAAFGVGLPPDPAPGVRGASLADGEALRDEWCVIVVGPHSALALIARDLGDTGPDAERRFEYALTEDRDVVMRAARALMLRVVAEPAPRAAIRADLAGAVRLPACPSIQPART